MRYIEIISWLRRTSRIFGYLVFQRGVWLCLPIVFGASIDVGAREVGYPVPSNPYAIDAHSSCGPRCAAFLLNYFRRDASYTDVLEKCPPGPNGTSLEQIKGLLEKYDVHTLGFSGATTGKLQRLRCPAIVHLNTKSRMGHFLVLLGWEPKKLAFRVYSPPSFYGYMPEKELADGLSGLGFAVSDRQLPPIEDLLFPEESLWPYLVGLLVSIILFVWVATNYRFSFGRNKPGKNTGGGSKMTGEGKACMVCLAWLLCLTIGGCGGVKSLFSRTDGNDREIDAGRIIAGPPIKRTFRVLNQTAKPFSVTHIRKSCSCQAAIYDRNRVVNHGDYAALTVEVPTKGLEGPQTYYFVLETDSNEEGWHTIPLVLKTQLAAKIKANPSQISFGTIPVGKGAKDRLVVVSADGNVCDSFRGFELDQQIKTVLLTQRKNAPTGMIELEVEIPPGAAIGDVNATIVLKFNDKEVPQIDVPVVGRVEGDIRPVPQVVMMSSGNASRRIVGLMSRNGTPFSITAVHSDVGIKVEPMSSEQGIIHRYAVFVEDGLRPGNYSITFATDQPTQAKLTLPVIVHE